MMHPRLLKTYLVVARTGNVTRAAEEIHLSQSSVSDQLQSLEADLGTSLFIRSKLGLELTPAGEALRPFAEEILALADEARAVAQQAAGHTAGAVTIGALETVASAKLPQWLGEFRSLYPEVNLRLKVAGSGELLRQVKGREIDAAFCFDRGDLDECLAKRTISVEPLVLIVPPGGHPASARGELVGLGAASFVATEVGCVYRRLFDEAFAGAGLPAPKIAAEVSSIGAIAGLVAAGAGLGLVPRLAVADALDRGEVAEMPWPGPIRTASLSVIWRRQRVRPPALKLFLAAASEAFAPVKLADARPRHAVSSLS